MEFLKGSGRDDKEIVEALLVLRVKFSSDCDAVWT